MFHHPLLAHQSDFPVHDQLVQNFPKKKGVPLGDLFQTLSKILGYADLGKSPLQVFGDVGSGQGGGIFVRCLNPGSAARQTMKLFKKLFSALNQKNVKYMVVGGIAVNLYGIERATADVDIIINLVKENLMNFDDAVKGLGLKPKLPVKLDEFLDAEKRKEWIKEKGIMVFSLYEVKNPFFLLDIFVDEPFDFDAVYKQRKIIRIQVFSVEGGGVLLPAPSAEKAAP